MNISEYDGLDISEPKEFEAPSIVIWNEQKTIPLYVLTMDPMGRLIVDAARMGMMGMSPQNRHSVMIYTSHLDLNGD